MSAITELRKKAEEKFPGYPVDFEDGTKIILKSSANFSEAEREGFNDKVQIIKGLDEEVGVKEAHAAFVDALASVSDNPEQATRLFAKESTALLTVIFDEYGKHVQDQEVEGAPKSKAPAAAPRTGRGRANR